MILHYFGFRHSIVLLVLLSLFLFNCRQESRSGEHRSASPPDMHNARIALDFEGVYSGITPCANCMGIETKLVLKSEQQFSMHTNYIDKQGSYNEDQGTFIWNDEGNTIQLTHRSSKFQYFVAENRLFQLDMEGNRIRGDLSDMYTLPKRGDPSDLLIDSISTDITWHLVELMGRQVDHESSERKPFIHFMPGESRVTGNSGCNSFNAGYETDHSRRISFGSATSTKMACSDMRTEQDLFFILQNTEWYTITNQPVREVQFYSEAQVAPLAIYRAESTD